jgi:hypothetical protein
VLVFGQRFPLEDAIEFHAFARLQRCHACDQCHSSRASTPRTVTTVTTAVTCVQTRKANNTALNVNHDHELCHAPLNELKANAPLLMSTRLDTMAPAVKKILQNKGVIAINQDYAGRVGAPVQSPLSHAGTVLGLGQGFVSAHPAFAINSVGGVKLGHALILYSGPLGWPLAAGCLAAPLGGHSLLVVIVTYDASRKARCGLARTDHDFYR